MGGSADVTFPVKLALWSKSWSVRVFGVVRGLNCFFQVHSFAEHSPDSISGVVHRIAGFSLFFGPLSARVQVFRK